MKASQWIDRIRKVKGLPSDYAVSKALGLSRFTISGYRQRPDATLDEEIALKVAHALGIDPATILADQAMERAKNEEARTAWAEIIQRLGGVAAGLFVAVGLSAPAPAPAAQASADGQSVYYVKRRRVVKKSQSGALMLNCWPFGPLFPGSNVTTA